MKQTLLELLFNLLLFCFLCGCGLLFFIKSHNLSTDATVLQQAVTITSSAAGIYESGDGSFSSLQETYVNACQEDGYLYIYLDNFFLPCKKENGVFYLTTKLSGTNPVKANISFYDGSGQLLYTIDACHYSSATPATAKEVITP